ncbi:MAG: creatininase family protein, partial [Bacteroidales bacterium]|nr:creatininase family protein [Bacteroidales bacterium]
SKYFDEPGDHAGELVTSIMLHIIPDLCLPIQEAGVGKAVNINLTGIKEGWVWAPREWRKISKDTGVGDPSKATAEKGKHFLTDLTQKIASFLVELDNSDPDNLYEHN